MLDLLVFVYSFLEFDYCRMNFKLFGIDNVWKVIRFNVKLMNKCEYLYVDYIFMIC